MQPEGVYEDGLLVCQILQMLLNDLGANAQDMVTLPVPNQVQEVHGLDHVICADCCLLRDFPDRHQMPVPAQGLQNGTSPIASVAHLQSNAQDRYACHAI